MPMLFFSLCFIGSYSTTVFATTEAATTETVRTRKFATKDNYNTTKAEDIWDACKQSVQAYQNEINIVTNVLIAAFVIIAGIVSIINCIRLTTIEAHPLAKKQEYISLLYNVIGVSLLGGIFFFAKFIIFLALGIK